LWNSNQNKNIIFFRNHPMNIPTEFVPIGLVDSEKKIKNRQHPFCLFYVFLINNKKNINFLEDYSLNIPTNFGLLFRRLFIEHSYQLWFTF
jgi:hypothetical protein